MHARAMLEHTYLPFMRTHLCVPRRGDRTQVSATERDFVTIFQKYIGYCT